MTKFATAAAKFVLALEQVVRDEELVMKAEKLHREQGEAERKETGFYTGPINGYAFGGVVPTRDGRWVCLLEPAGSDCLMGNGSQVDVPEELIQKAEDAVMATQ